MRETAPSKECEWCEKPLPRGCGHFYGKDPQCQVGPRTDIAWRIGLSIWHDLTDRRGIKHELNACDLTIQIELVETMGRLALEEITRG